MQKTFELRRYLRDFSRLKIQHFPARCLLFMNNNKDKSYSFWESTALTLSKFGVMILWIVFPWRPKVSLKYQFHTCLRDLSGSSRVKFVFLSFLRIKALRKKKKYIKFLLFLVAFYNQKISEIHFFNSCHTMVDIPWPSLSNDNCVLPIWVAPEK